MSGSDILLVGGSEDGGWRAGSEELDGGCRLGRVARLDRGGRGLCSRHLWDGIAGWVSRERGKGVFSLQIHDSGEGLCNAGIPGIGRDWW